MEKKIRFGDLVRSSGRPQVITLWTAPEKSPAIQAAMKQNRVLTVIQQLGKKDYGVIGFHLQPGAAYLVFPRALPDGKMARVVGINYQLVEEPVFTPETLAAEEKPKTAPAKPKAIKREPPMRQFKVKVRRTAALESEVTVEAKSRHAAETQAVHEVEEKPFEVSEAEQRVEVLKKD